MDLRHLRYFVAVAEELHFGRAAERLNIAPPTLTVQIQEMERRLAAPLFVRNRRSVALTQAGTIFLQEARTVLAQFARAESIGRRAGRGEIGRVEIGYVGTAAYAGVLQDQARRFRLAWPEVEVRTRELPMDELPRLVREGEVDIGFVRLPMTLAPQLERHVLLRDRFGIALPSDHDLAAGPGPIAPERLADQPLIVPEQQAGTFEVARRGGFTPRIVAAPGRMLAVLIEVSLGTGIGVVPGAVRDIVQLPNLSFRDIAGEPIPSEVAAIFRSDEPAPAVQAFIDQIRRSPIA